jgi:hypothetical protein
VARYRTIKPSIWTDEHILTLEIPARYLFIGLFSLADDEGFVTANAKSLNVQVFGGECELAKVRQWLGAIESTKMIVPVVVDPNDNIGGRYYHLPRFLDHQKINRPLPSAIHSRLAERARKEATEAHEPRPEPPSAPPVESPVPSKPDDAPAKCEVATPGASSKKTTQAQSMYREDVDAVRCAWLARFPEHAIEPSTAGLILKDAYRVDIDPRYLIQRIKAGATSPLGYFRRMVSAKNPGAITLPDGMKRTHGYNAFGQRARKCTKGRTVKLGDYFAVLAERSA